MAAVEGLPELLIFFYERLSTQSNSVAYRFIENSEVTGEITYGDLYQKSCAIAAKLIEHNTKEQRRALLVFNPGFDFVAALFACFITRTTAIPMAVPKPRTAYLFNHFLQHARPNLILTTSDLESRMANLLPPGSSAQPMIISTDKTPHTPHHYQPEIRATAIDLVQYTSGTTMHPKGVVINFDNIAHNLKAIRDHFYLGPGSVCFSWLPHYHDMGLIDGLLTPIFSECTGLLCSPINVVSNPLRWMEIITRYKVTHTGGPNFFFDLCTDRIAPASREAIDLRSLSHVYVSAEPVRKKTLERFSAAFQNCGFRANLFAPGYGLAEATLMVSCKPIQSDVHYLEHEGLQHVGLGRAIPGVDIKIINAHEQEDTTGAAGEICLSGPTITDGYFEDPAVTAASFIELVKDGRPAPYFKTGDLGFMKDGELFVVGRLKDTVIIRGLKYQPEDLEYVITQSHPALAASSCLAFTVDEDHDEKLVVIHEVKKGESAPPDEIRNAIKNSIFESFGLTVFDIILIPQGRISKTTSGKVRRTDNRMKYLLGQFEQTR